MTHVFVTNFMTELGPDNLMFLMHLPLVVLAWIYLHFSRKSARVTLFWGVLSLVLPYIGPVAMLIYFATRREKQYD